MSSDLQNRLTSSDAQLRVQAQLDEQARLIGLLQEALARSLDDQDAAKLRQDLLTERVEALAGPACPCGGYHPPIPPPYARGDGNNPSSPIHISEKSDTEPQNGSPTDTDPQDGMTTPEDGMGQTEWEDGWMYEESTDEELVCANRNNSSFYSCRCHICIG